MGNSHSSLSDHGLPSQGLGREARAHRAHTQCVLQASAAVGALPVGVAPLHATLPVLP